MPVQPTEPTTTLQALVNLKRPTIRLSPLASSTDEDSHVDLTHGHHQHHGLEFEFDCDAPLCDITLHVIGVPAHFGEDHPLEHSAKHPSESTASDKDGKESDRLLLYEAMVPGGFSRKLSLDDGCVLELARLEAAEKAHREALKASSPSKEALAIPATVPAASSSSGAAHNEMIGRARDHKRRFAMFRKRSHRQSPENTE